MSDLRSYLRHSIPWRPVLLTSGVLLAHWLLLGAVSLPLPALQNPEPVTDWAFSTRSLPAPAATTVPIPIPKPQQSPRPPRRPTPPAAHTAAPSPTSHPESNSESNIHLSPVEQAQTDTESIVKPVTKDTADTTHSTHNMHSTHEPAPEKPAETATTTPPVPIHAFAPSTRLKYAIKGEIKGIPYFVNGELLWLQDGKAYSARMEVSHFLLGSRVQTSTGQLTEQGLMPIRFGDKVRSEVAAHFVYDKGQVIFSANTPDAPLLPGAQDQLSIILQLGAMLGAQPQAWTPGRSVSLQTVGPRSSDTWTFTLGETENLSLPGGDVRAVRLWRDPTGEYDPKVELWLAPDMAYLPVRIRLSQANGDFVEQQWRSTQAP